MAPHSDYFPRLTLPLSLRLALVAALALPFPALAQEDDPSDDDAWLGNLSVFQLSPQERDRRGIVVTRLGTITLPSGRIVAVDPYTAWGLAPFTRQVRPGAYTVHLWFDRAEMTRPALAELRLRSCTPAFWQNAVTDGQNLFDLAPGEAFGYGVDAGAGSFAAPEFFETFGPIVDGALQSEAYGDFSTGLLYDLAFPDASGIPQDFIVQQDGQDMAVFSSGWGDGFYASYWGFDAQGCPCALVTDFWVLDGGYPYESQIERKPGPAAQKAPPFAIWGRDQACAES
jgi:hypothetical protein